MSEKLPEHLQGLEDEVKKIYSYAPSDADYAEIAFSLIKAGGGDKESLNKIAGYIQRQHQALKLSHDKTTDLQSKVRSWIRWAENWTTRKEGKS